MPRMLVIVLVAGLVSGLLVGGFHNLFTVPVMERAIVLEKERTAAANGGVVDDEGALVSLGVQRIGMAVGTGIYGAIMGLLFAGGFTLLRRVVPSWQPMIVALTVGALGFWALSLFPFIRYPLNPPGVGDESTLTSRQLWQTVFMILSGAGMAGVLVAMQYVRSLQISVTQRYRYIGMTLLAYAIFALVIVFAIPGNPDPVPVPIDLLELFRTLTMVGQFLQWALLATGVGLALEWYRRKAGADPNSAQAVASAQRES